MTFRTFPDGPHCLIQRPHLTLTQLADRCSPEARHALAIVQGMADRERAQVDGPMVGAALVGLGHLDHSLPTQVQPEAFRGVRDLYTPSWVSIFERRLRALSEGRRVFPLSRAAPVELDTLRALHAFGQVLGEADAKVPTPRFPCL